MKTNVILQGDCIEELKKLPDNSVDAIITDPPYDLVSINKRFGKEGSAPAQYGKDGSFSRLSGGFMGKQWDGTGIAFKPDVWIECLRVLKYGGYLLSFGGTRTYHRMTCGIEDAGFEIRDCIMWIYGSGFPKSLNIGKKIDEIQGNEREDIGADPNSRDGGGNIQIIQKNKEQRLSKGSSEWEGWGTALKPAVEPIVVARKPLSEKNVALNVLKWGTGGINIDESRIGNEILNNPFAGNKNTGWVDGADERDEKGKGMFSGLKQGETIVQGRFPANIILDEESAKMLDEQSGERKVGWTNKDKQQGQSNFGIGNVNGKEFGEHYSDKGGASRFFYVAKASKSERNFGCEEFETKAKCEIDKMGEEKCSMKTGSGNDRNVAYKNNHPTVKPIILMQYLIKLISREGAIILDPFLGSGTTAIACLKTNRQFIGIEKESDYVKIAQARIKPYLEQEKLL